MGSILLEEADIAELKCNQPGLPTTVLEFNGEAERVDTVKASSVVPLNPGESNPD